MPFATIEERRAAGRRHYAKNRARVRAASKKQKQKYNRTTKKAIQDYKSNHPCSDCHKQYPHFVMEFDHVPERGKKTIDISKALCLGWALARILKEIEKCDVVCANCHRLRTFGKRSKPKCDKVSA